MADRLNKSNAIQVPSDPAERQRFWINRGNRILWGQEATSKGDYLNRPEYEWASKDGHYYIVPRGTVGR